MTPEQFCYWLQGFSELSGDNPPTPEQWKSIREHIATVFKKVTPPVMPTMPVNDPRRVQPIPSNPWGDGELRVTC
jgi:hypothetical protein